jgi:MFS family permease
VKRLPEWEDLPAEKIIRRANLSLEMLGTESFRKCVIRLFLTNISNRESLALQLCAMLGQTTGEDHYTAAVRRQSRAIVIALLFPTMAVILNGSMFGVALPTIRDDFAMEADVAAWLAIAFTLPFIMFMPLYGRLGDELGKSRLLVAGLTIFCLGTLLALTSRTLPLLFLARIIQGAGSAGITPTSLAIIAERFPAGERGRAMGRWNSIAPGTSIFAPTIGGFLVVTLGWHTIFVPALVVGLFDIWIVRRQIPTLRTQANWAVLRAFDWGGVLLLGGALVFLVLYLSSRPVTGVEPLRDWRLLAGTLAFGFGFVAWERRRLRPMLDLSMLRGHSFRLASLSASVRMAMMAGIGFLLPLYLTDIYGLTAAAIGLLLTVYAIALFFSIRYGGSLADRWPNGRLVGLSLALQSMVMLYFALLPGGVSIFWIVAGMTVFGLGAGLSLAALHRTALGNVAAEQTGSAAGVYSMTRFAGAMLATAMAGVILQSGLNRGLPTLAAYQIVFGFLAGAGLLGVMIAVRIKE